jgi:dynein heavy chain
MFDAFLVNKTPENWEKVAYPSLKPLGNWFTDFLERYEFYLNWNENIILKNYWISGLFFP